MLQTDPDRYRRYYQRIVLVIGLATMPLGLFISIYAGEITHVLLGPKWIAATVFLQIFGVVAFLKPSLDTTAIVMMTYGLSKRLLTISFAYYVSLAAFMFVGLYWGAEGVALANVGAIVLLMLPMLYFSLHRTPVTLGQFFNAVSTPAIASLVMAGILLAIRGVISGYGMTVSLFAGLGIAACVYAGVALLLPRGRREIVALVFAVLGSFKRPDRTRLTIEEPEKVSVA
jgi:PST family polysaccharide transporter